MKIKTFHQMVLLEKGPVNTAILDMLKGTTFQVENLVIDHFQKGNYEKISEFIEALEEEELIIEIEKGEWMPDGPLQEKSPLDEVPAELMLEIEEGTDLALVKEKFSLMDIANITFYGAGSPESVFPAINVTRKMKDYSQCIEDCRVTGSFGTIDSQYCSFNSKFNTCWGRKLAVTKDNTLRPCIHSEISLGKIGDMGAMDIINSVKKYWFLTAKKVDTCKDCELGLVCFNCREEAYRASGDVKGRNPHCAYNPYTGEWKET